VVRPNQSRLFRLPAGRQCICEAPFDSVVMVSSCRICRPNVELVDSSCGLNGSSQIYI